MKKKATKASALLLTTILLFVILSMVVSLSYVTVMEQKMSQKTKSSVGAFFNADSGVEWALNKIATGSGNISGIFTMDSTGKVSCPNFTDDTSPCDIYLLDVNGKVITADGPLANVQAVRSVGTQNTGEPTQRAIEAAVGAGGGGGCYVSYGKPPVANRAAAPNDNCIIGFTDKGSVGSYGACKYSSGGLTTAYGRYFFPPNGVCVGSFEPEIAGDAYLCCQ